MGFFTTGHVDRAKARAKLARLEAKAACNRYSRFTDDELYALLNALTFAVPTFGSHCEDSQQWSGEWKINRAIAEALKGEITSELREREGK